MSEIEDKHISNKTEGVFAVPCRRYWQEDDMLNTVSKRWNSNHYKELGSWSNTSTIAGILYTGVTCSMANTLLQSGRSCSLFSIKVYFI